MVGIGCRHHRNKHVQPIPATVQPRRRLSFQCCVMYRHPFRRPVRIWVSRKTINGNSRNEPNRGAFGLGQGRMVIVWSLNRAGCAEKGGCGANREGSATWDLRDCGERARACMLHRFPAEGLPAKIRNEPNRARTGVVGMKKFETNPICRGVVEWGHRPQISGFDRGARLDGR